MENIDTSNFIELAYKFCDQAFIEESLADLESVRKNKELIETGSWNDYFKKKQIQFKQSGMTEEDVTTFSEYAQNEKLKDIFDSKEMYEKLFPHGECVFKTKVRKKVDKKTGKAKDTKPPVLSVIAYSILLDRFYDEFVAFTNDKNLNVLVNKLNSLFHLSLPDNDWYNSSKKIFEILDKSGKFSFLVDDVRKMAINKIGWRLYCNLADKDKTKGVPYNLILTGAPGTGKTYMAKNILAAGLIMGKPFLLSDEVAKEQVGFVQFHQSYDYSDFIEGLRPVKNGTDIIFERKDGIFKEFCKRALSNSSKIYVFIIDEINRGEMSRIFGELFFSIDPGYRGTKGSIKTQYANLEEEPNDFDKALGITKKTDADGNTLNTEEFGHFFVPKNVYVIGTMNDIDRSVESMDFAMRRRFAFKEIKADDRVDMWDGQIDAYKQEAGYRMKSLNKAVELIPGLSSAYHVGPSYFLKLKDNGGSFADLWNSHLEGLLFEYLRGMPDVEELCKKLYKVYNDAQDNELSDEGVKKIMGV